jgi:SAM-dependent methyltransferase
VATVTEHYGAHLAPIYLWMAGGMEAALSAGATDLAPLLPGSGLAVDLGAGFGMHSIPMARGGYQVIAVDSSSLLLQTLRDHSRDLRIQTLQSDLLDFRNWVKEPAQLIVCMGDTLTHLQSLGEIQRLCEAVARALAPTGTFMATFRDYTVPAKAERRFIPVRSDADRILTCFLEESREHIDVHDIVHERDGAQWNLKVSSYRKLRLAPAEIERALRAQGLMTELSPGPRGMLRVVAKR